MATLAQKEISQAYICLLFIPLPMAPMHRLTTFVLACLCSCVCLSQKPLPLSEAARISLMTVDAGEDLYTTFGHSAIRVQDQAQGLDLCYNYGTFDFDQPNFYLNFCRGKLLYMLDTEKYRRFEYGNIYDQRAMREQVLNLTQTQKQRLYDLLEENYKPENRFYKYDFFYDNCATRIRDIIKETFYHEIVFDSSSLERPKTMRQLLKPHLKTMPWTAFGMDLVLGYAADRVANAENYMYLPFHLHDMVGRTRLNDSLPLVVEQNAIPEYAFPKATWKPDFFGNPLMVTCMFALIGLLSMANARNERIFDLVFWFVLGVAGLIIFLLWFATDHSATKLNFNILWALPTHLFFFWRSRQGGFADTYFAGAAIMAGLVLLFWKFIPQEMPIAAIPIAALVVVKGLWHRGKEVLRQKTV